MRLLALVMLLSPLSACEKQAANTVPSSAQPVVTVEAEADAPPAKDAALSGSVYKAALDKARAEVTSENVRDKLRDLRRDVERDAQAEARSGE